MKESDRVDASFYDYYATGLEGDVQFYVEEAQRAGSPVLELGCGTGRILIPVAEAGIDIVGLDLAPSMLAIARQKVSQSDAETRLRIELIEGDMRDLSLGRKVELVMIPYRAFLHMLTPEDERRALLRIHEHLTDDGRLVFNVFDPRLDLIVERSGPLGTLGTAIRRQGEFAHPETGHRVMWWSSGRTDPERQMIEEYFIFEELDDEGKVIAKTYSPFTGRYVYRYEMQYLLELCGFKVGALYGDFQRGPFRYGGEQIWVARKK